MTHPSALAEYTAYKAQALNAARQRISILQTAAQLLERVRSRVAADPHATPWVAVVRELMDMADEAGAEMRAAINRTNQAAALCGQPPLELTPDWAALTGAVQH